LGALGSKISMRRYSVNGKCRALEGGVGGSMHQASKLTDLTPGLQNAKFVKAQHRLSIPGVKSLASSSPSRGQA
jgi:hypothetical protein